MTIKLCPRCERRLTVDPQFASLSSLGMEAANPQATCICGFKGQFKDGLIEPRIPDPTPKMPYCSVDIETTGLDPNGCQVLEIGAVYDDWTKPLKDLPTFHCYVLHDTIVGTAYALALNRDILRQIANKDSSLHTFLEPVDIAEKFSNWLVSCGWNKDKGGCTPAGKNFASFDRQFLKKLPNWEKQVKLHHRTLDPAMLYWLPDDEALPDSKTCYLRAGLPGEVAHTALEDAKAVVWLLRHGFKRLING
jgi:hypothetical protein